MPYRKLDPDRIISTAQTLAARVAERFPDSGLSRVAAEMVDLARDTERTASELEQPIWWLRGLVFAAMGAGMLVFIFVGTFLTFDRMSNAAFDFVQGIEALINMVVLLGLGLFTLVNLEERFKRRRVLASLHELRSIIHVIDMHQLTKDPVVFTADFKPTASSPKRVMGASDLKRYLDYCSELLSLSGKLAALHAQSVNDTDVVESVNDIENLAANLSRKIWQKIAMIEPDRPSRGGRKTGNIA